MIGYIATNNKNALPNLDIPVGDYTLMLSLQIKRDIRSVILQTIQKQHTSLRILRLRVVS
ncbi:MAG: hypothetical protein CM15mV11_1510 [Caudoviricetes sp.]|nr:MAG: hypothetical protein CM15mV11_1510 [Caudoviricetes sp.]